MEPNLFSPEIIREKLNDLEPSPINFLIEKCDLIKDGELLSVDYASGNQKFVLIKSMCTDTSFQFKTLSDPFIVYPDFTIRNNRNKLYFAFNLDRLEGFTVAEANNLDHLTVVLKTLAKYHLERLDNEPLQGEVIQFDVDNYQRRLEWFKDFDEQIVKSTLNKLGEDLSVLSKNCSLFKCLTCPQTQNVLISNDLTKCVFLRLGVPKLAPPAYDVVSAIMSLTDNKFRQDHFEDVINVYYQCLFENVANCKITRNSVEWQIKVLLPAVKFEYATWIAREKNMDIVMDLKNFLNCPLLNQEDIYQVVKTKLNTSDYELLSYELVPLKVKNGHLGDYYHLNINCKYQNEIKKTELFAKYIFASTTFFQDILDKGVSKKEDFFYTTFLQLLETNGLGSLINFGPKCYLSKSWLLVLDDLSKEGFVGLPPNQVVGYDGLKAILSKLATFHASSILLEEILSQKAGKRVTLNDLYSEFLEEYFITNEETNTFKVMLDSMVTGIKHLIQVMPEVTGQFRISPDELEKRLDEVFFNWIKKTASSDLFRNVICHGDMYVSNALFKFNEHGVITEGKLIDFQGLRYCPLGHDVLYFIYISSLRGTRLKYMDQLLEQYYTDLCSYIDHFGFDSKSIYSKEEFDQSMRYMKSQGIMHAFCYSPLVHLEDEDKAAIGKDSETFDYYLNDGKNELIDMAIRVERHRMYFAGLLEDLLEVIDANEY